MHGIVHQTIKTYVTEHGSEQTWNTLLEQTAIEPQLYLAVSRYPDDEIETIFETLTAISAYERGMLERDFGRMLAPRLLDTFSVHVNADAYVPLLTSLEEISQSVRSVSDEMDPPRLTGTVTEDGEETVVVVTYQSSRGYCSMAHGILEGMATHFEADATVTHTQCSRDDASHCRFRVVVS